MRSAPWLASRSDCRGAAATGADVSIGAGPCSGCRDATVRLDPVDPWRSGAGSSVAGLCQRGGGPDPGASLFRWRASCAWHPEIQLLDADGKQVAELSSDDDGRFRAQVPAVGDYRVVAKSGDGHRAEWPIAASELIGVLDDVTLTTSTALAAGISSSVADASNVGESPNGIPATPPSPAESSLQDDEACFPAGEDLDLVLSVAIERGFEQALEQAVGQRLEQAIGQRLEQAVARQVLPLREALAEAQAQASLRDLLGGLGYIAGLAGFALWWTRRRERRHSVKDNSDG